MASSGPATTSAGKSRSIHGRVPCWRSTGRTWPGTTTCARSAHTTWSQSMSSAVDSPASTFRTPASRRASMVNSPDSGTSTHESFANYDHDTSSWRTSQLSLFGDSSESSVTWPRAGMTRSGTAYPLPPLAPLTAVTGYGLLQHAIDCDMDEDCCCTPQRVKCPTPTAGDAKSSGSRNLAGSKANLGVSLTDFVKFGNSTTSRGMKAGGALNPRWVEWLMGYPDGWTDLGDWATPSSRKSRNGSPTASRLPSSR